MSGKPQIFEGTVLVTSSGAFSNIDFFVEVFNYNARMYTTSKGDVSNVILLGSIDKEVTNEVFYQHLNRDVTMFYSGW